MPRHEVQIEENFIRTLIVDTDDETPAFYVQELYDRLKAKPESTLEGKTKLAGWRIRSVTTIET